MSECDSEPPDESVQGFAVDWKKTELVCERILELLSLRDREKPRSRLFEFRWATV